jgi:hypothetical protein
MQWQQLIYQIVSALLTGGLAGHLTATYFTSRLTTRRDHQNWLRNERYKLYSQLLEITSAVVTREKNADYSTWPDEIRVLSQKVHLLCPTGHAQPQLAETIEQIFQLVLKKKLGRVKDDEAWRHRMREIVRRLRELLAESLRQQK